MSDCWECDEHNILVVGVDVALMDSGIIPRAAVLYAAVRHLLLLLLALKVTSGGEMAASISRHKAEITGSRNPNTRSAELTRGSAPDGAIPRASQQSTLLPALVPKMVFDIVPFEIAIAGAQ